MRGRQGDIKTHLYVAGSITAMPEKEILPHVIKEGFVEAPVVNKLLCKARILISKGNKTKISLFLPVFLFFSLKLLKKVLQKKKLCDII